MLRILVNIHVDITSKQDPNNNILLGILSNLLEKEKIRFYLEKSFKQEWMHDLIYILSQHRDFSKLIDQPYSVTGKTMLEWAKKCLLRKTYDLLTLTLLTSKDLPEFYVQISKEDNECSICLAKLADEKNNIWLLKCNHIP